MLLDALGAPDRAYRIIHVAGTKGKGSTCAFIDSVARNCGITTGLFTTPHLHSVRERIQVAGQPVTEDIWASAMAHVAEDIVRVEQAHPELGSITAFELNTAMALLVFADAHIDLAVVEVGLGGRLDATNVVTPNVAVITPISFDHQAILGDTLTKIGAEKAGIIKPGGPVVVANQPPEAMAEIRRIATAQHVPLLVAGDDWHTNYQRGETSFTGPQGAVSNVVLGLGGAHQASNAGAAIMALSIAFPEESFDVEAVAAGLSQVQWPGRFEMVSRSPMVIVDGAHNDASMEVLADTIRELYPEHDTIVIFGAYRDKDIPAMLSELAPLGPLIITTRSKSPRAQPQSAIRAAADQNGLRSVEQGSVAGAMRVAIESADAETIVIATGSLSVVAEAREYFGFGDVSQIEREILSG